MRVRASILRSLVWKLHAWLSKLHSTCTKEQFEKILMLGKKVYCFITFEFYSKYVRSFCRKISARWSKLHFTSRNDHFKKEQISRIKQKFWIFLGIRASNLRSLVKASSTVVKTAFYMYEGKIREKSVNGEKRLLFLSLSKYNQNMFGVLAEKFRHGVQNCFSRLQMILPRKKNNSLE